MGELATQSEYFERPRSDWAAFPAPVSQLLPQPQAGLGARDLDLAILELAEIQDHAVGTRQLLEMGLTNSMIAARVKRGLLHRVLRGAYAVGRPSLRRRGWWTAALLASPRGSALSVWSAASAWDLIEEPDRIVHIARIDRHGKGPRGIRIHRPRYLLVPDLKLRAGLPVTSVPRTLLDLAALAPGRRLRRLLERVDQLELFDPEAFDDCLGRAGGHRGAGRLRRALAGRADTTGTRSEQERMFLRLCHRHHLDRPATNVVVAGLTVDAYWPSARLVVELDGFRYHRSRESFDDDRRRDLTLRSAGFEVMRLTRPMLTDQSDLIAGAIRARSQAWAT